MLTIGTFLHNCYCLSNSKKSNITVTRCCGWFLLLLFFPTEFDVIGIDLTANDTTKAMRLLGLVVGWTQLGRFGRTTSVCQIRKYSKITVTQCCGWFLLLHFFPTEFDVIGIDLTANDTTKAMRLLGLVVGWTQLGRFGRTTSVCQIRKYSKIKVVRCCG